MIPAALLVARHLPWKWIGVGIGALAIVLSVWRWHDNRVDAAVQVERDKWAAISAAKALAAAQQEAQWAARVNEAATALARSQANVAALSAKQSTVIREFYRANPDRNGPCLDADRVRAVQERDAALAEAASSTASW